MIVESLLHTIEGEGIELHNKEEVKRELQDALFNDRFHIITDREGKGIGFFTWFERTTDRKLCIFINNFFILKEHKGKYNLCKLRGWFRSMYPRAHIFYWKSRRRNKLFCANPTLGGHYV